MSDPLAIKLVSLAFALLLAAAAWHKLADQARFRGILGAYQVLPELAVAPVAALIPALEAALAAAWALAWNLPATGLATAVLLAVYSLAIALNLRRGRTFIDCGCGFGAAGGQQLSGRLLWRNGALIALSLSAALPAAGRELLWIDYLSLACACLVLILLYAAGNQLLLNAQTIESWCQPAKLPKPAIKQQRRQSS